MDTCLTCNSRPVARGSRGRTLKFCSPECRQQLAKVKRAEARRQAQASPVKACGKCQKELPKTSFHADAKRIDGLYPWCGDCRREYQGSAKRITPTISKADYDRERRAALALAPDWEDRWRRGYLWSAYRMTPEQYQELFDLQGGRCAICRSSDPGKARGRDVGRFAVDHDHGCCPGSRSCGRCIRGLLCRGCNTGIGLLGDDPVRINAAAKYVAQASASSSVA